MTLPFMRLHPAFLFHFICTSCCHSCPHIEANTEGGLCVLSILAAAHWVFPEQKGCVDVGTLLWLLKMSKFLIQGILFFSFWLLVFGSGSRCAGYVYSSDCNRAGYTSHMC